MQDHPRGGGRSLAQVDPSNDFGPLSDAAGTPASEIDGPTVGTGNTHPRKVTLLHSRDPDSIVLGGDGDAGDAGDGGKARRAHDDGGVTPVDAGGAVKQPPLSGITITLGTTVVPKEEAIAFIHFGHSNMAGRAVGPTEARPYFFTDIDPHAWMYHVGSPPQPALEPFTADDDLSGDYGGPGTAIVKEAAALAPGKHFISLGFAKSGAYCSQFLPGALYYDSLMEAALAIKDRVTFGAIIIMLGITEHHTYPDYQAYPGCINTLVTAIRKDVGRPDLPVLITDYEQEATGSLAIDKAFAMAFMPYIRTIPMVVSNSVLVPTDGLGMQDDHHFNFDGHKLWVSRALQIMKDKGWFPW
ncbi:MAG TPA: sialate O-acetylesterase [Polyangiaceae bacterium]|nr:sialate O-acetylesterase [Polyangiaceae bacterium]